MRRLIIAATLFWTALVHAVTVQIDYTYDSSGFFAANPAARVAVEKAAADLSAALTGSLGAVSSSTITGTNGNYQISTNWFLSFDNPSTTLPVTISPFSIGANIVPIYVGARSLGNTTLGNGGPVQGDFSGPAITGTGNAASFNAALVNLATKSNALMNRASGPVIGNYEVDGQATTVSMSFGSLAGRVSFNADSQWHFDINTLPADGMFDFYSVALHEIIHSIGFGTSDSWWEDVNGTNWLGENVIALTGSGMDILNAGQDHIKAGTESPRISDGVLQLAIMDPAIAAGTRKELTELDLAFLRDLGFATVPEPGTIALAAIALLALGGVQFARRRG